MSDDFMELQITQKGRLVSAECSKCGSTMFAHEWASWNFNEDRDKLEAGTAKCSNCLTGTVDKETYMDLGRKWYAARYSAPGYLDCTEYEYDTNYRRLERTMRQEYAGD